MSDSIPGPTADFCAALSEEPRKSFIKLCVQLTPLATAGVRFIHSRAV